MTVMSHKKRSTLFSHDAEVAVKCMTDHGRLVSYACTAGCLCVAWFSGI